MKNKDITDCKNSQEHIKKHKSECHDRFMYVRVSAKTAKDKFENICVSYFWHNSRNQNKLSRNKTQKQIRGVNNKQNTNFELKKIFRPKKRFFSLAEHSRTKLVFHEFSVFHFLKSF